MPHTRVVVQLVSHTNLCFRTNLIMFLVVLTGCQHDEATLNSLITAGGSIVCVSETEARRDVGVGGRWKRQ